MPQTSQIPQTSQLTTNIRWVLITKNNCKKSFEHLIRENDVIPTEEHKPIKTSLVNKFMLLINTDSGNYLVLTKMDQLFYISGIIFFSSASFIICKAYQNLKRIYSLIIKHTAKS